MQIKLPSLGENIESGDVLSIFVKEGDVVAKDQDLLELETDKATMPVPSPQAGKIVKVLVSEGQTVPIGEPLFEIDGDGGGKSDSSDGSTKKTSTKEAPKKAAAPKAEEPADDEAEDVQSKAGTKDDVEDIAELQEEPAPKKSPAKKTTSVKAKPAEEEGDHDAPPAKAAKKSDDEAPEAPAKRKREVDVPGDGHSAAAAGPAVRRLARELGVDLRRVRPSGDSGRITEEDLHNYVRKSQAEVDAKSTKGVTPPGSPDTDAHGAVRREKMSRTRQTIARNMLGSLQTIPQLTNFDDVDVTELEHMRKESQKDYEKQGVKLTTMPFLVKAIAVALKHHPIVNASVSDEGTEIIYKEYVSVGIAVDTERGLVVPVLRDADRKNIPQIAQELAELAELARSGKFTIEDLRGGTFTISNLGAIGGTYSTPIINPPEAAILLVGRSRMMPHYVDGGFQPRLMMPLSLTYDHRIVDGAAAARFLNDVKGYLATPGRLLLAP
jgi:pyruvate dehydrogenase E2 component (dihydrolipoamide acetyltransferase)